jgi:3-deoxy-D-manno-octulosonic-acid transferase
MNEILNKIRGKNGSTQIEDAIGVFVKVKDSLVKGIEVSTAEMEEQKKRINEAEKIIADRQASVERANKVIENITKLVG